MKYELGYISKYTDDHNNLWCLLPVDRVHSASGGVSAEGTAFARPVPETVLTKIKYLKYFYDER